MKRMRLSEQLAESLSASEALYGFAGWLTTRRQSVTAGSRHDAARWADLVKRFSDENALPEPRDGWHKGLKHPTESMSEQLAQAVYLEEGIFQGPPAMLRDIGEWMRSVFAGHILALTEKNLELAIKPKQVAKERIESMRKSMAALPGDLKKIEGTNRSVSYKVWYRDEEKRLGVRHVRPEGDEYLWYSKKDRQNVYSYDKEEGFYPRFQIGQGKKRPHFDRGYLDYEPLSANDTVTRMRKKLGMFIETQEATLKRIERRGSDFKGSDVVDLKLLERECRKYADKPKEYTALAKKEFPVDITGWKYMERLMKKYAGPPGKTRMPLLSRMWIEKALKKQGFDKIRVVLSFKKHEKSVGTWFPHKKELRVDFRTIFTGGGPLVSFRESLDDVLRTLRHEVQHLGQDVLTGLLELGREAGTPSAELDPQAPHKSLQQRYRRRRRKIHPRREEEFYTRLADEIDRFVKHVRKVKLSGRRDAARGWVDSTYFFRVLKKHEPAKYRKAVGEFIKGVEDRGVELNPRR
jgi:hypothetical protein